MRKLLVVGLLVVSISAFADGISMSFSVDDNSSSNTSSVNVIDKDKVEQIISQ